jgi:hypothetical protein
VLRYGGRTQIAPTPDGRVVRTIGVNLQGLAPGDYELVLVIEDEEAHAVTSRTEPFSVY